VEDHIRLWEILSNVRLTHLGVSFCALKSKAANKEKLISLYQKCWTVRGIQCAHCYCGSVSTDATSMLSYFPSLNCGYFEDLLCSAPTIIIVQDVINSCTKLKVFSLFKRCMYLPITKCHDLQQIYISESDTDVPDDFMMSISGRGGLVHVVMRVKSITVEGIHCNITCEELSQTDNITLVCCLWL